jgi:hypothetical protein
MILAASRFATAKSFIGFVVGVARIGNSCVCRILDSGCELLGYRFAEPLAKVLRAYEASIGREKVDVAFQYAAAVACGVLVGELTSSMYPVTFDHGTQSQTGGYSRGS